MDALEICNKINMEAESLADSGFPLEVFPQKMQSIIIDMVVHGNFKVDYVAPCPCCRQHRRLLAIPIVFTLSRIGTRMPPFISYWLADLAWAKLHHYSLHTSQFGSMNESCLTSFAMNLTYMRQHVQQRKAEARK